jgi:hypothetical protein
MADHERFLTDLREALVRARRAGSPPSSARIHPERLKLIEAEYAVTHDTGVPRVEGVEIVADPSVAFEDYAFTTVAK